MQNRKQGGWSFCIMLICYGQYVPTGSCLNMPLRSAALCYGDFKEISSHAYGFRFDGKKIWLNLEGHMNMTGRILIWPKVCLRFERDKCYLFPILFEWYLSWFFVILGEFAKGKKYHFRVLQGWGIRFCSQIFQNIIPVNTMKLPTLIFVINEIHVILTEP